MLLFARCLILVSGILFFRELPASQNLKPMDSGYITRTFNQLIRESHPNWWGNFNLDPLVKPGAIGVIDVGSGVFQPSGQYLGDFETIISPLNEVMKVSTEHVREPKLVLGGRGRLAQLGDAQVQLKWEFSQQGAMASRWMLAEKQSIKDPGSVIKKHMDLLRAVASYGSMYDPVDGISQGFGVITSVILARGGMNLAALSDGANWSVSGQASYLKNMLTSAGGEAEALYSSADYEGNMACFVWPGEGEPSGTDLVPVAYTFASLDGERVMLHWIRPIGSFRMIFNNHGDHYVGISVSYSTPAGSKKVDVGLLPYLRQEVDSIPLDATNLTMTLSYLRIMKTIQTHRWKTPLGSWPTGDRHIDIKGSWPMYPSFSIEEEGYSSQ